MSSLKCRKVNIEKVLGADDDELAKGCFERIVDGTLAIVTCFFIFIGICFFVSQVILWMPNGEWKKWGLGDVLNAAGFDARYITGSDHRTGWQKLLSVIFDIPFSNVIFVSMPILIFIIELLKPEVDSCIELTFRIKMFLERSWSEHKRRATRLKISSNKLWGRIKTSIQKGWVEVTEIIRWLRNTFRTFIKK